MAQEFMEPFWSPWERLCMPEEEGAVERAYLAFLLFLFP